MWRCRPHGCEEATPSCGTPAPIRGTVLGAAPKPLMGTQSVLPHWLPSPGTCQGVKVGPPALQGCVKIPFVPPAVGRAGACCQDGGLLPAPAPPRHCPLPSPVLMIHQPPAASWRGGSASRAGGPWHGGSGEADGSLPCAPPLFPSAQIRVAQAAPTAQRGAGTEPGPWPWSPRTSVP